MLTDLTYACRRLVKSPSFAVTAILTLALGIGANAVVFSVLNALVLHTLDVPNAQSLGSVEDAGRSLNSYPDYLNLRDRSRSFDGLLIQFSPGGVGHGWRPGQRLDL